jgi:hypothetical protein
VTLGEAETPEEAKGPAAAVREEEEEGEAARPSDDGTGGDPNEGTQTGPRGQTGNVGTGVGPNTGTGDGTTTGSHLVNTIGQSLQGYATGVDDTGWGDASSEGPVTAPRVDSSVVVPNASDDWGDLNNPQVMVGLAANLVGATLRTGGAGASAALLGAAQAVAAFGANLASNSTEQ